MIQIPYKDMIAKIKEGSGLSEEEIESRIKAKMDQLSGLISKDGAAHIIANELGVKLIEAASGKMKLESILPGMRAVETVAKVMAVYEVREFQSQGRSGKVGSLMIGDETGSMRLVCWGDMTSKLADLSEGDIIRIKDGYVKENRGTKEIHLNDRSLFQKNPPGEKIGPVKQSVALQGGDAQRKSIVDLSPEDMSIELLGTVVQSYEPKFYEICPECGSRAKPQDESFICSQHGSVKPDYAYLVNIFLDDGTSNIRTVFFREQVDALLGKSNEEVQMYRQSPELFEPVKASLLGNIIKVRGRVRKNEMFDRLEFNASFVDIKPDPELELKR